MTMIEEENGITVTADPGKNRLHLKFLGRWEDSPDAATYLNNVKEAVSKLKKDYTLLVEVMDKKPPSLKATGYLKESQKIMIEAGVDKTAVVMGKGQFLQRMSLNVVGKMSGMDVKTFTTLEEAAAWLDQKGATT